MKKLITLLCILPLCVALFAQSGTCGDNLTWELNNGTLAISGNGSMTNYTHNNTPWYSYRESITKVIISDGVTSIGSSAFEDCSSLTSIEIPNSVTSIGEHAFAGRSSLTSIEIPNSVTSIGGYAFCGCSRLTSIVIPNSVTNIGESAFWGCSSLTSIVIPNSVTSIGTIAFGGCSSLTSIAVAAGNPNYDSRNNCNAIIETATNTLIAGCKNTIIPNSVTSIREHAFDGCSSLTSIEIPISVTSIEYAAFDHCSSLTSVEIPNSVTNIGGAAFEDCSSLTSIEIPNSVTSIGTYAFADCSSLTSIVVEAGNPNYDSRNNCNAIIETATNTLIAGCKNTIIPNSVTSIGGGAFDGCSSLTSIEIPISVTSIEYQAFSACSSLTSIEIPNSVTTIGDNAFLFCSNLINVTLGNSVDSIHRFAFMGCSIKNLIIPKSVRYIADDAFWGSDSLSTIIVEDGNPKYDSRDNCNAIIETSTNTLIVGCQNTIIPNSVISIGGGAFNRCSSLTSIVIPNSVTSIGGSAFERCSGLASVTCLSTTPPQIASNAFNGVNTSTIPLYVPESVELYKAAEVWKEFDIRAIESIEPCVLDSGTCGANGDNLTWKLSCDGVLTISGEGEIKSSWYQYQDSIKSVIIEEGVTNIGDYAFSDCSNLTSIEIPNSVTSIGSVAFRHCDSLTSIVIPNSVTSIGGGAFEYCSSLTSIVIPNSVTSIGDWAFAGCSSLTNVTLSESIEKIEGWAFFECSNLTSIEIPNSVKYIGIDAFASCSNLINVTLGNSVDTIDGGAFIGCSIKNLIIPKSVRDIANDAFWSNYSLSTIIVEDGNPKYDSRDNCNAIIETSTNTLIVGCQNTIIPNSVTSIGSGAFNDCDSLTNIVIPNSVKNIGGYVFAYCKNLNKVTCYATTPPQIASDAFDYVNTSTIPLYVPAESVELYKAAEVWKEFDIRAIGDSASFTVNFVGFNGADLGSQQVAKGDSAIAPDPQTPNGYTFIGWDKDFYNVQSDMTITAIYSQNTSNETITITNDVYVSIYQNNEAEYSEKNINLAAGSAFIVDTLVNLEVGTITQNINLSSAASIYACAENLSADTLKIQFDIKTGIWYYLCFPFDIPFNNISSPGQYVIYEYDGATRAQKGSGGWQRTTSGKFTAMKGYIFQASENGTLIITIENPQFPCSAETILPVYASQYQQHANWSLIGNPYPSYYNMGALRVFSKFNAPVYVRCKDKDDYDVYIPADDEYHFRPYEAFFVQNPNNAQSTIYWNGGGCETASQIGIKPNNITRRERQAEQNRYFVEITLVGNNSDDHTRVVFNDEAGAEYELGRDAVKMDGSAPVRLYTLDAQTLYAINEQPTSNKAISLGYKVAADGEYTLSASRMDKEVEIYDNELQQVVDLRQGDYKFTTQAGVNNTRFTISVKADMPTGINSDIVTDEHVTIYTITGIMLYDNVMLNDIQLQSGIYIIKSATKIEKVVVK